MVVGVNELLTRLAERLTTLVLMSPVPEKIDVLVAVLALEMILAHLLDYMLLVAMSAAKHSTTLCPEHSSIRHAFFVVSMAFWHMLAQ